MTASFLATNDTSLTTPCLLLRISCIFQAEQYNTSSAQFKIVTYWRIFAYKEDFFTKAIISREYTLERFVINPVGFVTFYEAFWERNQDTGRFRFTRGSYTG